MQVAHEVWCDVASSERRGDQSEENDCNSSHCVVFVGWFQTSHSCVISTHLHTVLKHIAKFFLFGDLRA